MPSEQQQWMAPLLPASCLIPTLPTTPPPSTISRITEWISWKPESQEMCFYSNAPRPGCDA